MNTPDNLRYKEDISVFLPLQNAAKSDKLRPSSSHMHNGTGKALPNKPRTFCLWWYHQHYSSGLGIQAKSSFLCCHESRPVAAVVVTNTTTISQLQSSSEATL